MVTTSPFFGVEATILLNKPSLLYDNSLLEIPRNPYSLGLLSKNLLFELPISIIVKSIPKLSQKTPKNFQNIPLTYRLRSLYRCLFSLLIFFWCVHTPSLSFGPMIKSLTNAGFSTELRLTFYYTSFRTLIYVLYWIGCHLAGNSVCYAPLKIFVL